ncbi:MAG: prepilin-type N-terminal cleavage/methylation domain-containing protein [Gammaproteobacteria bacterium]|nr:prepilin-type N-terminal cleavage/methylation domain-containing protein [Gammaproteobacteria bacterium]
MASINRHRGFSLLELILVVVLLGVLASGAGLLITRPIEAYSDQLRRQQLVDQAEMALRQIARDVRRALPNSIRITAAAGGWALEMVNTIDGARYRDEIDPVGGVHNLPFDLLDFSSADTDFNVLGQFGSVDLNAILPSNQRLVIYNTGPADIYQDINAGIASGIVTSSATNLTITDNAGEHHINMNPAFRFTQQSPGQRMFVIDGAISYVCNPASRTITRYDNYPYQTSQPGSDIVLSALPGVQSGRVVTRVASSGCEINYNPGTPSRGGLVSIRVVLDDSGEDISLLHQIHVVNVP